MGILFLVRHAQASFLEQNYDKLSALGERRHVISASIGRDAKSFLTASAPLPSARKTSSGS